MAAHSRAKKQFGIGPAQPSGGWSVKATQCPMKEPTENLRPGRVGDFWNIRGNFYIMAVGFSIILYELQTGIPLCDVL